MNQIQMQNHNLTQTEQARAEQVPAADCSQTGLLLNEWDLLLVSGGDMTPVW